MQYRTHDSVRLIPGIGPKSVELLDRMGIRSISDLLHWFPRRYIDGTNPLPLNLVPFGQTQAVRVTVEKTTLKRTKKRSLSYVDAEVTDGSGVQLTLRFFNQPYVEKKLTEGSSWTAVGSIERFHGQNIMSSPLLLDSPQVIPVYLQSKGVTTWALGRAIKAALPSTLIEDVLPAEIAKSEGLPSYSEMLRLIHLPESLLEAEKGRRAMAFIESFDFFMGVEKARTVEIEPGHRVEIPVDWLQNVVKSLPFELTAGQKRVVWDMLQEMQSGKLMTRLLNGDVGSGKTVVAALLAAVVAQGGQKSVLLAPTEILAVQHARTISELLRSAGCHVALWTGSTKEKVDDADIIVGTHALLYEGFSVENIGLVVVDEQHRFGVKQRAALRDKQHHPPHVLAMTATPIPRTLALVLFADLQVSFLKEKPKNRVPIETTLIPPTGRIGMEEKIAQEIAAGHQVFVLCPLIETEEVFDEDAPKDAREIKTVVKEAERLRREHPEFGQVAALHGRMKPKEKAALMEDVKSGKVQVLVATSVIEVGVDLPNATVMVVENAERFGLAQLHQLRGRVGRGADKSYCFLCPTVGGGPAIERLKVLVESDDGFEIAEKDLDLRGPGDITGFAQSGLPEFKMARLTDLEFLQRVKTIVQNYVAKHPNFIDQWHGSQLSSVPTGLE